MSEPETIEVTTRVSVAPSEAFEVFIDEIDLWWRRGLRYRMTGDDDSTMGFEPLAGGRFVERTRGGEEHELGRVLTWDPPRRVIFTLGGRDFELGDTTEVEVCFEPDGDGTRVSIEQRGFERLAPDHPARHGMRGNALRGLMGNWWGALMISMQQHAQSRP